MTVFCEGRWQAPTGNPHSCIRPKNHEGACFCCSEYPGGDLSLLPEQPLEETT
jgi:hypothetical protein